ncbi:NmrA-like family protein [Cristinia sonorae]|uniref:NmrA-like family protein n=1 Tax=Cristinia sonorae TaxID=1940300 RepID=A0A8K0XLC3_9AGAR|nr:NmrA-like family protein [Cristinia sonorae]
MLCRQLDSLPTSHFPSLHVKMVKYVLTGATGVLGSRIFKELLQTVPASDIAVSLYNPSGPSEEIRASGVEVRHGDYTQPSTLVTAFSNATKLLIISYPSISLSRVELHKAAIDAAKTAGVEHVYYTSLAYADDSLAAVMHSHLETEKYLKASGLKYTIVREGMYNEVWPLYLGVFDLKTLEGEGELTLPIPIGDGKIAWAAQDDLGAGTARILAAPSGYENRTVVLTGSRATSLGEVVAKISGVLQRKVSLQIVPEEMFVQYQTGKLPEETLRGP